MENVTQKQEMERRERIRRGILLNITTYLVVIAFLAIINFMTSPGYWWVIWPALGWGLGLTLSIVSRFLSMDQDYDHGR